MTTLALVLVLLGQAEPVVLKGGRIVPVAGPDIESGMLLIADGKVRAVGQALAVPPGAQVLELPKSSWILPGFIDAHSHLGSAFDVEESAEALTPEARAVEAFTSRHPDARAAMSSGVTLVALSPGNGNVVGGQVGVVRLSGDRYDLALLKSAVALKASIGFEALRTDREPTSRTGAVALLRTRLSDAAAPLPMLPIFLDATFPAEVESALDLAKASGRPMVLVHARPTAEQMQRLAASKIPVAVEPLTTSDRRDTLELPGRLAQAGVRFAFVSDAPAIPEELLRVSASFAVKYGLSRETALRALTTVPAELLGLQEERGSIGEGKAADLVVWSGDPLSLASEVLVVMIDGRVTWRKAEKP
ncbi:MAG TPA: amidohydrolase family protein [Planctomycetota bacterium]|jgi:imidazolonepropionase-like amidohydrolase|nr:amidohydrolase family protein [Planctomycetota bacterium]